MKRLNPAVLFCLLLLGAGEARAGDSEDVRGWAQSGEVVLRHFAFRQGGELAELRLHYSAWGKPQKDDLGRVRNAIVCLHGTGGSGIGFGGPISARGHAHPLFGVGGVFDTNRFYVIAPDAIGSGVSAKPSEGLRMRFPAYDLSDTVRATRLLLEELGVQHALAVVGVSMGGREAWQFAVQCPEFMDGVVPMIASPFPNAGRRGFIDYLPEAIILNDPAFAAGNYQTNPASLQLARQVYGLFLGGPASQLERYPTRQAVRDSVYNPTAPGQGDACDYIYQLRLNDGFDAWSQIDRVQAEVFMINMSDDLMVPVELRQNRQVARRLPKATYLEVSATGYGHGGLMRTIDVWGPKLSRWLQRIEKRQARAARIRYAETSHHE
jgi:homoserine O-acetyltransferase/O-succinyltransferase